MVTELRYWLISHDGERHAYRMFRRHYSAAKNPRPKIRQFVGPGEKLVLIGFLFPAVFAWRKARFRADGQRGVECTLFRNESEHRSSDLIVEAMAIAWERWPGERLFTQINGEATNRRRSKRHSPGHCFRMAGWTEYGLTKGGLLVLEVCTNGSENDQTGPAREVADIPFSGSVVDHAKRNGRVCPGERDTPAGNCGRQEMDRGAWMAGH